MTELDQLHQLIIEKLVANRAEHLKADQLVQAIRKQLEAKKDEPQP